jgi:hypothetical protein
MPARATRALLIALHLVGWAGAGCRGSGRSDGSGTRVVAKMPGHAYALFLDGGSVYWVESRSSWKEQHAGAVYSFDERTDMVKVLSPEDYDPCGIAADSTSIYWTRHGRAFNPSADPSAAEIRKFLRRTGAIVRLDKAGGRPVTLVDELDRPCAIAVDGESIYFEVAGEIRSLPKAGGAPTTIVTWGDVDALAIDDEYIYFAGYSREMAGWQKEDSVEPAPAPDAVLRVKKDGGGEPEQLATGITIDRIVLDGDDVYGFDGGHIAGQHDGAVFRVSKRGGSPVKLATGQDWGQGLAVDGNSVYWTALDDGKVWKMPKAGGPPVLVASGQEKPRFIVASEDALFWSNDGTPSGTGTIIRAPIGPGSGSTSP